MRASRLRLEDRTSAKGNGLSILNSHKLHRMTVLAQPSMEAKPFITV